MDIKNSFKHVFTFDALLNIVVGFIFLFLSEGVESLLFNGSVLPHYVWIILGAGFLYFAYWQIRITIRSTAGKTALIFALAAAWVPALLVTVLLVVPLLPVSARGRLILWIGNCYLILLGGYYFLLIRNEAA